MDDLDLSEFHGVFFEEADEHLASMESLLLEIDVTAADAEQLNAIFRAAHSIKGGAGAFGFKDIAELTHEMETVFDRVRKGQMPLSRELVDVFLVAGDMLKAMFEIRKGEGTPVPEADVTALCVRLRLFLDPAGAVVAKPSTAAAPSSVVVPSTAGATVDVRFGPFNKTFSRTSVKEMLVRLAEFGTFVEIPVESDGKKAPPYKHFAVTISTSLADFTEAVTFLAPEGHFEIVGGDVATPVVEAQVAEIEVASAAAVPTIEAPTIVEDQSFGLFAVAAKPEDALEARQAEVKAPDLKVVAKPAAATATADASSIRVSVQKVDELINLVGELVITQAMLAQAASDIDAANSEALLNGLAQLQRNTRALQESAMSIRMLPMSFVFGRFPRVVRDLAATLKKQVELKTEGESTELDKGLIERITDPLTHLVRNSLDHGIEEPAVREAAGKPAKGTITLRAFHRGGNIVVEVSDDGGGMSRDKLLAKARERGMSVSDTMTDTEVFGLIFEAGFSTAEKVTDVSGRGVGMDVVRRNIREMGGSVEIDSVFGFGTRITIRLPLTLAILDGMSVGVGKEVFIVPLTNITESLQPSKDQLKTIAGRGRVVQVRGDYLPVLALHEAFNLKNAVTDFDKGIMVVLEHEGAKTALFVDDLLGQHQVVIKSLETNYRRVHGVSGATIMGDGRVALILDVAGLVNAAQKEYAKAA
jgi:two-component system chemotaxis sensor kinase CheA